MQRHRSSGLHATLSRLGIVAVTVMVSIGAVVGLTPLTASADSAPTISITGLTSVGDVFSDVATYATVYSLSTVGSDDPTATYEAQSTTPDVCSADIAAGVTFLSTGECTVDLTATPGAGSLFTDPGTAELDITVSPATTVISVNGTPDTASLSDNATYATPYPVTFTTSDPTTSVVATFDTSNPSVCPATVTSPLVFTGVGQCVIDLTSTDTSGDYTNLSVTYTINVGPATPVISVGGSPDIGNLTGAGTYGAPLSLPSFATDDSSATFIPTFDPSSSAVCSGNVGTSVTFTGVGHCVIDLTSTDTSGDYTNLSVTYTINVGPATPVISVGGVTDSSNLTGSATYGAPLSLPSFATDDSSATFIPTFDPSSSAVCSGNVGTSVTFTGVGQCVIDLTSTDTSGDYTNLSVTYTINVGPATPVISVGGVTDASNLTGSATYGASFTVPKFTTSDPSGNVTPTFDPSSSAVCSGTVGTSITFASVGTCVIDLTSSGTNGDYTSPTVTYTINVGPATPVISVGGVTDASNLTGSATYGASFTVPKFTTSDPSGNVTPTFDPSSSAVCSGTVGTSITFASVGTCVIDLTSSGTNGDYTSPTVTYTINVGPATPVISVGGVTDASNLTGSATYGASFTVPKFTTSDPSGNVTPTFDPSSSAVCSGTVGSTINFTSAGTCVIDLTSSDTSGDYTTPTVSYTVTVGAATSSIDVGGVTDTGNLSGTAIVGRAYNVPAFTTNDPSVTVNATFDPSSSAVCSGTVGSTINFTSAGTCVIDLASSSTNPNFKGTTATFTITVSLPVRVAQATLSIEPGQVTLASHELALATTGGSGSGLVTYKVVGGTAQGCVISGSTTFELTAATAGTCIVQATKASDLNYLAAESVPEVFRFQLPEAFDVNSANGVVHSGSSSDVTLSGTGLADARIISESGVTAKIVIRAQHSLTIRLTVRVGAKPGRYDFVVGTGGNSARRVYFTLETVAGSNSLKGHVSLKPQVVSAKVAQTALSVLPGHAKVGTSLIVRTIGGSGSGALNLRLVGGTATGCVLSGTGTRTVRATGPGSCVVVATKAGDATHRAVTSPVATFTFVAKSAFEVTGVTGSLQAGATSNIVLHGNDFLAGGKVTVSNNAFTWHVVSGDTTELTIQVAVSTSVSPGIYVLNLQSKAGGLATVYLVMTKSANGHVTGRASLSR